ncbi:hypothetical protein LXL04_030326 [Taraxacum kok-saghyz]
MDLPPRSTESHKEASNQKRKGNVRGKKTNGEKFLQRLAQFGFRGGIAYSCITWSWTTEIAPSVIKKPYNVNDNLQHFLLPKRLHGAQNDPHDRGHPLLRSCAIFRGAKILSEKQVSPRVESCENRSMPRIREKRSQQLDITPISLMHKNPEIEATKEPGPKLINFEQRQILPFQWITRSSQDQGMPDSTESVPHISTSECFVDEQQRGKRPLKPRHRNGNANMNWKGNGMCKTKVLTNTENNEEVGNVLKQSIGPGYRLTADETTCFGFRLIGSQSDWFTGSNRQSDWFTGSNRHPWFKFGEPNQRSYDLSKIKKFKLITEIKRFRTYETSIESLIIRLI